MKRDHVVRDKVGRAVRQSKNLRGVREHARLVVAKRIELKHSGSGGGFLRVEFCNGDYYDTIFASFTVLRGWVRRWRSVYGAQLVVDGVRCGHVSKDNPRLKFV